MNKRVIVVAAHPDDEVLGCGGSIAKHILDKDEVFVLFMSEGTSSRIHFDLNDIGLRKKNSIKAASILGVTEDPIFLQLPDNRMDSLDLLSVVKKIEKVFSQIKPEIVYTHYTDDLNIDHQIAYKAVMTACRPVPHFFVKEIYSFEVLSSTEWSPNKIFTPNYYKDVSDTIDLKMAAMEVYDRELNSFPHPRSTEAIKNLAKYRGSSVGIEYAEAFKVERIISFK
jgi:LmbE family N-acetylglucosaminyl deacetylase